MIIPDNYFYYLTVEQIVKIPKQYQHNLIHLTRRYNISHKELSISINKQPSIIDRGMLINLTNEDVLQLTLQQIIIKNTIIERLYFSADELININTYVGCIHAIETLYVNAIHNTLNYTFHHTVDEDGRLGRIPYVEERLIKYFKDYPKQ